MSWGGYLLTAAAAAVVVAIVVRAIRLAWMKYRGPMLVECPENHETAAVGLKMGQAVVTAGFGQPRLELRQCSRWPEKEACGQECLKQIEAQPADCMVRTVVTRWYEDKSCASCGKPLGRIDWLERRPALMSPEGVTVQWPDVPPEELRAVFATHKAVCWDCHIAESFRRQHPDLVTENRWKTHA